jgi:hypothetical protein
VQINLGRFDSEIEAALAYDRKALEIWGEFARLNFPPMNRRRSDAVRRSA